MKGFAALEQGTTGFVSLDMPTPGDYEMLVKIEACVICNSTDFMVINNHFGAPGFPVVFGHESFGKVVLLGNKVKNFAIGDRVTRPNAIPTSFDGFYYSAWGGFAEYGIAGDYGAALSELSEQNAGKYRANKKVPLELSLPQVGLVISLSETASCLMQIDSIKGKSIVVLGTGIAGLSLVYFAKRMGANTVVCIGKRAQRLAIALQLGADSVYLQSDTTAAGSIIDDTKGGADWVFEATGKHGVLAGGVPYLKRGGSIGFYGVPEQPYAIDIYNSPQQFSMYVFSPKEYMATEYVCDLLQKGKVPVDLLMTHSWRFDELPTALDQVRVGEVVKGMVIMDS